MTPEEEMTLSDLDLFERIESEAPDLLSDDMQIHVAELRADHARLVRRKRVLAEARDAARELDRRARAASFTAGTGRPAFAEQPTSGVRREDIGRYRSNAPVVTRGR